MKEYKYELFGRKDGRKSGIRSVSCRVYRLDETQIEVFDLILTEENTYCAWTCDTVSEATINRRKEIENELNRAS